MAKKSKLYVVWDGHKPGVYKTWDECKAQTHGYAGAKFKAYEDEKTAREAFEMGYERAMNPGVADVVSTDDGPNLDSLSVDAACSGNPGIMEYQCVETQSGKQVFHQGPFSKGTNNIGEFLAIVDTLRLLKERNSDKTIYSDSQTALAWVRNKKVATNLVRDNETERLWTLVDEAVEWLRNNEFTNPILKWKTDVWGEIKADFGRK